MDVNFFVILGDSKEEKNYSLSNGTTISVGRDSACDMPLEMPNVSHKHCILYYQNEVLILEDVGSSNGTYVNGLKISKSIVSVGDFIQIGSFKIYVQNIYADNSEKDEKGTGRVPSVETASRLKLDRSKTAPQKAVDMRTTLQPLSEITEMMQNPKYRETLGGNIIYKKSKKDPAFAEILETDHNRLKKSLELLHDIGRIISQHSDFESLMFSILEKLLSYLEVARGCLLFKTKSSQRGFSSLFLSPSGETGKFTNEEFMISRSVLQAALNEGVGTVSANTLADSRFEENSSARKLNIQSVVCVPLEGHSGILGALYLDSTWHNRRFRQEDLDIVTAIGRQVGLVIERMQAVDALQRTNERLEDLVKERTSELMDSRQKALEANRAKSAFLANMSHELRTPLNAIIGYSELILEDSEEEESIKTEILRPDLKKISTAGKHLLALINDILDISKIESGKIEFFPEKFTIDHLVEEVKMTIQTLIEKNKNTFEIRSDPNMGSMFSDLTKLRQCIFNLLANAAKFTENGKITLDISLKQENDQDWIIFSISDTGIGISAEQKTKLFKAFSQVSTSNSRRHEGAGLGLAISQRICQLMGGEIYVKSKIDEGSTFIIHVPRDLKQNNIVE